MDADGPVDAQNAPTGPWKTADGFPRAPTASIKYVKRPETNVRQPQGGQISVSHGGQISLTNADGSAVILLAAVALESMVNDLQGVAESLAAGGAADSRMQNLARVLARADGDRASLLLRIDLAHLALSGVLPDRGAQPYQDIDTLIKLRNLLVHARPEVFEIKNAEHPPCPKIVLTLVSKGIIAAPPKDCVFWQDYATALPVAVWAVNTAVRTGRWLAMQCSDVFVKRTLEILLGQHREIE